MEYGLLIRVNSEGINVVDSQLKHLNSTMKSTETASNRVEKGLNPSNVNRFSSSVRQANAEVQGLNSSFKTLGNLISTGVFLGVANSCISASQEVATLKAQLRALGEDADSSYKSLRDFSLTLNGIDTASVVKSYASFKRLGYSTNEAKQNVEALAKGLISIGNPQGLGNLQVQLEQLANRTTGFAADMRSIQNYLPDSASVIKNAFKVTDYEDLEKLGVTGKDVVNTLIAHYGQLEKPQDDINTQMAKLNATIQDIKASAGGVFATFVPQIQKVADILDKFANSPTAQILAQTTLQVGLITLAISKAKQVMTSLGVTFQTTGAKIQKTTTVLHSYLKEVGKIRNLSAGVIGVNVLKSINTLEELYKERYKRGLEISREEGTINYQAPPPDIAKDIYKTGTSTMGVKEESDVLRYANNQLKETQATVNKADKILRMTSFSASTLLNLEAERERRQSAINTLADKYLATSRLVVNSEEDRVRKNNTLFKLEQQILNQRNKILAVNNKILAVNKGIRLTEHVMGLEKVITVQKGLRNSQIGNVWRSLGRNIGSIFTRDGLKTAGTNVVSYGKNSVVPFVKQNASIGMLALGGMLSNSAEQVMSKYSAIADPLNASIQDLTKVTREQVKEYRSAKLKQIVGNSITTGASVGMMTGSWKLGLVSAGAQAAVAVYENYVGEIVRDRQRQEILTDNELLKHDKDYKRAQELQQNDDTDLEGQKLEAEATIKQLKDRQKSQQGIVDEIKGRSRVGRWFSNLADEEKYLDNINSQIAEQEERLKNVNNQYEKQKKQVEQIKSVKEKDLDAEIKALDYQLQGNNYQAQLVQIQRAYAKVVEDEKASTKEKEKAYKIMQLQTKELEKQAQEEANQKLLKEINESGSLEESNYTVSGQKYYAELVSAATKYKVVCNDINTSLKERARAYNEYKIAVNKAQLNQMEMNNTLYSARDRYFGNSEQADKRDIMSKYLKTANDITATSEEKETSYWQMNLSLLDKNISKIKTYFSTYIGKLQEVISKRKETTDSVINELQRERDARMNLFSQGQQAIQSSGYFDMDSTATYSEEEIKRSYDKYNKDKQYQENLKNQVDKTIFGGDTIGNTSTKSLEAIVKNYDNMNKYIQDNNATGMNLFVLLKQFEPYIKGNYNILSAAYRESSL